MGKIAFIAPYEEIYTMGKRIVADLGFSDRVDCYLGWLGKGVEIARKVELEGIDVIISRGGTAELIVQSGIQVPVVEIPISFQDIAETLLKVKKIADLDNPRIAVLAFRNMILDLDVFQRVMDLDLFLYELNSAEEISSAVELAYQEHADIVIGGIQTTMLASARGMKTLILTSGEDSYRAAVLQADKVSYARTLEKERMEKFRVLVDYSVQGIIGIGSDRKISVFNSSAERLLNFGAQQAIGNNIDAIFPSTQFDACMNDGKATLGELITANNRRLMANIIPIDVGETINGAMITIEDVGQIVEMEATIRNESYRKGLSAQYHFEDILGSSEKIAEVKRIAGEYAEIDATVLITGASGTGKELYAQSMHNASRRRQRPFVAVNCGAIPSSLLESELFGYVEGAFTGAHKKGKTGLFELAHGGTIFLDEIGEMDKLGQTSLLRAIQERRVMRLGGDKYLPVDVRIIAATNRDLTQLVKEGRLREDLYYRINVLPLVLPSLRDCPDDALFIAKHFLAEYNRVFGRHLVMDEQTKSFIAGYDWPGNVRELRNYIERLVVTAKGNLIAVEPAARIFEPAGDKKQEKARIISVLAETKYNQKEAAKRLGINRSTLYRKLKSMNIEINKICGQ
jgi:transcriptional regulator with PAS, ATPase and Fis domain